MSKGTAHQSNRPLLALLVPFGILIGVMLVFPLFAGLLLTLTNYSPASGAPLTFVGLAQYARIFRDRDLRVSVLNTASLTGLSVIAEISLGILGAYALRVPFRSRSVVRFLLLVPWLISPVASGVMWRFLLNQQSLIADPFSLSGALLTVTLVEVWRKAPLAIFLLTPGLTQIPIAFWDYADLDGLRIGGRLRHIVLPHLRFLIITVIMLLICDALGTAESLLILTGGGPGSATLTLGLYSYQLAFISGDWQAGAALAWVTTALVLLIGAAYVALTRREAAL